MTKKSITKNYMYSVTYQIMRMILPLITVPYVSRVLGAKNIGIYGYTTAVTAYFILIGSLGIAMYGQREIAYYQNDRKNRSKTFYEILYLRFITLGISLLIFFLTFCIYGQYHKIYLIFLIEIISHMIDIAYLYQGLEEFKGVVFKNIIVKLISVVLVFIFVNNQSDLWKYVLIYLSANFLGDLSLWTNKSKFVDKVNIKDISLKKHIKPTVSLFIPQIAIQVYTVLDKAMLGYIITDKREVGYYEQADKVIRLLLTLATSFTSVMMPRIASIYAEGNLKKLYDHMKKSFVFVSMITFPLMFGIITISSKFVPIFYGSGYNKVSDILMIISPIIVIIGLGNVLGNQYLLPTKKQNKYTISVIVGAIVNFTLNLILIKNYKSIGVSIATIIAESCVTITQFILVRKEIKVSEVLKVSYKYIISSIVMFIFGMIIGKYLGTGLLALMIQIVLSAMVYFIVLIILKDEFVLHTINKFMKRGYDNEKSNA